MTCSQLFQPFKYNIFFSNVKTYCALKAHEIFFIRVCAGVTCLADGGQRDTMIHAESSCTKKKTAWTLEKDLLHSSGRSSRY